MSKERRHFSRVDFQSTVTIFVQPVEYQAELVDISLKGALISMKGDRSIDKGEACVFELRLDKDTIAVKTDACIVYSQDSVLGLRFDNLDLESMTHLRRLIELNTGDSEQVQQELFFLATPKQKD